MQPKIKNIFFAACSLLLSQSLAAQPSKAFAPAKAEYSVPKSAADDKWKLPQRLSHLAQPTPFLPKYSVEQLPFFCKMEAKWNKTTAVPFKFRLGEVQEEEKMEGKH